MPSSWTDWLLPASSAVAGGLMGRAGTTTRTTTFDKGTTDLTNQLLAKYTSMLQEGPGGYIASGTQNINKNADLQKMGLENILAQHGISGPAAAQAEALQESRRFADVTNFENQGPLNYINEITKGFSSLPHGETITQKEPGNVLGGVATGFSSGLAALLGQGLGGNGSKALSFPSVLGGLEKVGGKIGGAVTSGGSKLIGLAASNPWLAAGIGAGVGGALLAKHFIGQGRRAADKLTGEGGIQRSFEDTLKEIDSMNIPDDQKWQHKTEAYQQLVQLGLEQAKKGKNEYKTVSQMFDTISHLFGQQNPLKSSQSPMDQMQNKYVGAA